MLRGPLMGSSRSIHPAPNFTFKKSRARVGVLLLNALRSLNSLEGYIFNPSNQFENLTSKCTKIVQSNGIFSIKFWRNPLVNVLLLLPHLFPVSQPWSGITQQGFPWVLKANLNTSLEKEKSLWQCHQIRWSPDEKHCSMQQTHLNEWRRWVEEPPSRPVIIS